MMKKQGMLILCIMTTMAFFMFTEGCQKSSEEIAEKMAEEIIERSSGGDVDIDYSDNSMSFETEQGTINMGITEEWPDKIPLSVPKFSSGKIVSATETDTGNALNVFVVIEEITSGDFDKYKSDVEGAGWTITTSSKMDNDFVFIATKEKASIMASFSRDEGDLFSGGIRYIQGE